MAGEIRNQLIRRGPLRTPKGTHVDLEVFDDVAPFVDWQAIRATVEREWFSVLESDVELEVTRDQPPEKTDCGPA